VAYELRGRSARLVVDQAIPAAGWMIEARPVAVRDVLEVAPAEEVEPIVRRAVAELRSRAASAPPPASEQLRALAIDVWRDFATARANADQPSLPGL
jgi:hypothetical protein